MYTRRVLFIYKIYIIMRNEVRVQEALSIVSFRGLSPLFG